MLNNLPFDPRLLAGLQSVLSERADSATDTKTVPCEEPLAPTSPAENQPGTDPEPATASKTPGRDERGKFTKGNFGGPGNPFARQTAAFRKAIHAAVTEADLHEVAKKLVEKAKEGDVAAMKLLLSYTVGKPGEAVNPDLLDVHEVQSFRQQMMNPGEIGTVLQGFSAEVAAIMLRYVVPALDETQRQMVVDKAAAQDRAAAEASKPKHARKGKRKRREETAADEEVTESHRQQREQSADELDKEDGDGRQLESTRNGREPSRNGDDREKQYDPDMIEYGWEHFQNLASEWRKERDRKRKKKKKKKRKA